MEAFNRVARALFDGVLYPFRTMHPLIPLALLALLAALGVLVVVKRTSNQAALARVKRAIQAGFFEMRLFADDPRLLFAAQWEVLRHNLAYLRYSLPPMLWLLPPFVVVLAQLQLHFAYRGLRPGDKTLVAVTLAHAWEVAAGEAPWTMSGRPRLELAAPAGLRVETPGLWMPSQRTMTWRVGVVEPGSYAVAVTLAGARVTKSLDAASGRLRRSPSRLTASFVDQLLYPAEPPLPSDVPIRSVTVTYSEASVDVLGFELHWMVVFFVLTMAFAFALRNRLGVVI